MDQSKLSKDTASEPSFRVLYYGGSGAAVPFKWESQPGTPIHPLFSDYSALPPLTPPPSYLARPRREPDPRSKTHHRKLRMVVLLASLPRLLVRRGGSGCHVSPASSKGRKARPPLMFALMDEEELGAEEMRMCFGGRLGSLKNALYSVVGRRRRRSSSSHDYFT